MKWQNKGHEFDNYADQLLRIFEEKQQKIYIFGAGLLGEELAPAFERYHCFEGYIDNDVRKQLSGVNGRKVISFQHYIQNINEGIIIIAADKKNIPDMECQLRAEGMKRGDDFWIYTDFMQNVFPVLSVYKYDVLYANIAQICLTERCTLKCRDCAHGCYAINASSKDMSMEMLKKSADSFFSWVGLIKEFVLIGGEPFLYENLDQAIEYIGEKYRDKMIIYSITTNGTILPQKRILDLCKKYSVLIRISNYSGTIKRLERNYMQLKKCLDEYGINYTIGSPELQWMDYGFQSVDRGKDEKNLIQVFDKCKTPCREIRGSRYYYCVMARSVSDNLGFGVGCHDYLDLDELKENGEKIFLEFDYGYSDKGYLDMCNYCNGADAIQYPIPAAVQMG